MPSRLRALIVGRNGHNALLRSMSTFPWLPPSDPDCDDEKEWQATTCDNASDAATTWLDAYNQGVPFSLVFSPLAPNTLLDGTIIDPARREICLASGIGLFHFIRTHGGTTTPLIAVVRGSSSWGAETLYAAAAHDWFGAGILDTVLRNSSTGQPLYIPAAIDSPLSNGEETLARQLRIRANIIWETLHSIETQRHRGNLSQPLGHALQWLRIIIKLDYKPQLLETVAAHINSNILTAADGLTLPMYVHLPTTRKTIAKYLVETFDNMRTIAIEYVGYDRVWAEFGLNPPKQFWDSPCTRAARHFIDLAYNFLVFEDIDIPWLEFSQRMPPPPVSFRTGNFRAGRDVQHCFGFQLTDGHQQFMLELLNRRASSCGNNHASGASQTGISPLTPAHLPGDSLPLEITKAANGYTWWLKEERHDEREQNHRAGRRPARAFDDAPQERPVGRHPGR